MKLSRIPLLELGYLTDAAFDLAMDDARVQPQAQPPKRLAWMLAVGIAGSSATMLATRGAVTPLSLAIGLGAGLLIHFADRVFGGMPPLRLDGGYLRAEIDALRRTRPSLLAHVALFNAKLAEQHAFERERPHDNGVPEHDFNGWKAAHASLAKEIRAFEAPIKQRIAYVTACSPLNAVPNEA